MLLLPEKDILLIRRVHSAWRATITGSSKLQQVIFLTPVPLNRYYNIKDSGVWIQPIDLVPDYPSSRLLSCMRQPHSKPVMNPLIELFCPKHNLMAAGFFYFFNEDHDPSTAIDAAATSSESIWKMSVVQPPSRHIMVERLAHRRHTMPNRYWSYIRGAGDAVTLAELLLHMAQLRWHGKPSMYFAIRKCSYDSSDVLDPYGLAYHGLDIVHECIYR